MHLLINKMGAHPRPCGEHAHSGAADLFRSGSSPPVRGAQFLNPLARILGGLIPARAGSTRCLHANDRLSRAHPRPCGEHTLTDKPDVKRGGSSPPVRGAQENGLEPCHQSGLIPARAGSTHLLCRYR